VVEHLVSGDMKQNDYRIVARAVGEEDAARVRALVADGKRLDAAAARDRHGGCSSLREAVRIFLGEDSLVRARDGRVVGEIEEPTIEQVPASNPELASMAGELGAKEAAQERQNAEREHVLGMQKASAVHQLGQAAITAEHGIVAFEHVIESNPLLKRAEEPSILGAIAAWAIKWFAGKTVKKLDEIGLREEEETKMKIDLTVGGEAVVAGVAEQGIETGLGAAVEATEKIGDYLERIHEEWIRNTSIRRMSDVAKTLRLQVKHAFDTRADRVKLASLKEFEELMRSQDLTKPLFVASDVSDILHVLFSNALREPMGTSTEWMDAARGTGERQRASNEFGNKRFGPAFTDERSPQ
jgi:hypothetical protein